MSLVVSLIGEGGRDFLSALVIRLRTLVEVGPEVVLALVLEVELEVLPDVLGSLLGNVTLSVFNKMQMEITINTTFFFFCDIF